ncbi:MAG: hypothetical protein ACTH4U_11730, partial [Pseudoalteromonas prydzensis]
DLITTYSISSIYNDLAVAYTRDDGNFSEVMRARISELNAKIDALNIEIDQQIIIARLNYYASSKDAAVMAELLAGEHNEH